MASAPMLAKPKGPRRSILDLAPLELECLNALWPAGEATVRQIQQQLFASRPRAYTTIMTIMDRLAHKGVVTRRKQGKAYVYAPNLTADQARAHAVEQLVDGFFEGSPGALAAHLAGTGEVPGRLQPRIALAERAPRKEKVASERDERAPQRPSAPATRLDETLL